MVRVSDWEVVVNTTTANEEEEEEEWQLVDGGSLPFPTFPSCPVVVCETCQHPISCERCPISGQEDSVAGRPPAALAAMMAPPQRDLSLLRARDPYANNTAASVSDTPPPPHYTVFKPLMKDEEGRANEDPRGTTCEAVPSSPEKVANTNTPPRQVPSGNLVRSLEKELSSYPSTLRHRAEVLLHKVSRVPLLIHKEGGGGKNHHKCTIGVVDTHHQVLLATRFFHHYQQQWKQQENGPFVMVGYHETTNLQGMVQHLVVPPNRKEAFGDGLVAYSRMPQKKVTTTTSRTTPCCVMVALLVGKQQIVSSNDDDPVLWNDASVDTLRFRLNDTSGEEEIVTRHTTQWLPLLCFPLQDERVSQGMIQRSRARLETILNVFLPSKQQQQQRTPAAVAAQQSQIQPYRILPMKRATSKMATRHETAVSNTFKGFRNLLKGPALGDLVDPMKAYYDKTRKLWVFPGSGEERDEKKNPVPQSLL